MGDDTIAAISTALGDAGIGIVRLSGQKAVPTVDAIFKGKVKVTDFPTQTIHYGTILDPVSKETIDEVLVTLMSAPRSYTREDVVEINCHGGIVPLRRILELVLAQGARLAEPGEFTKRAFLNGRIDLAQAEAVIDVVRSRTEASLKIATQQLQGGLSRKIRSVRKALIDILTGLEVLIDFEDEEIEDLTGKALEGMREAGEEILSLIETSSRGKFLREGIRTVILGRPNVGKSSLLNALLGRERAIVTHLPGTTRDTIEEAIDLGGIPLRIIDTAGIQKTDRILEQEGVKKTLASLDSADLVLLVLDSSRPLSREDRDIMRRIGERQTLVILNKSDLPPMIETGSIERLLPERRVIRISATLSKGLEGIKEGVRECFFAGGISAADGPVVTQVRHEEALRKASLNLDRAIKAAERRESSEFIALDIREAIDSLGEILGERLNEEILDRIFSQFCIGK